MAKLIQNKKLFDVFVVRNIVSLVLLKAINDKIKKNDIERFIDDNMNDIIQMIIKNK